MPQNAVNPNQLGAFQFPGQGLLSQQTPAFTMPEKPADMASLYGLMAQYADKPAQIGMDYAARMQAQQNANAQNSPFMQMMEIYGNINPHDFEASSIQKFHENLLQTGKPDFSMLTRYDPYSSVEQKTMTDLNSEALKGEEQLWRFQSLAEGFERFAGEGAAAGVPGRVEEFFRRTFGKENELSALRTQFNNTINNAVLQSLPPGVASDKDIAIAMGGWPAGTSNPEFIAAYLRVMRGVQGYKYAQTLYRARYMQQNRGSELGFLDSWQENKGWFVQKVFRDANIPLDFGPSMYDDTSTDDLANQALSE
jgi:hypothetical protein